MGKVLKLVGGVPESKLNWPPNSCIPSSANMRMKRKSRKSREMMLRIELSSDITRFLRLFQYLVTLKIRRSLRARRTERPKEPDFTSDQITSKIDPEMTTQSKRLKLESKYVRGPSAYTLMNISNMNRARNTNSAKSVGYINIINIISRYVLVDLLIAFLSFSITSSFKFQIERCVVNVQLRNWLNLVMESKKMNLNPHSYFIYSQRKSVSHWGWP